MKMLYLYFIPFNFHRKLYAFICQLRLDTIYGVNESTIYVQQEKI
jgi:hypothetical protein